MTKNITFSQITKEIKNIDVLLKDLLAYRERVKIGFLNGNTPRLLSLLNDTIEVFEAFKAEWKDARKRLQHLKYLERKEKQLKESVEAAKKLEAEIKPIPLVEPPSKREEKKRKALGKTFTPSRKRPLR